MKISNTILRSFVAATKHMHTTGPLYSYIDVVRYQDALWLAQGDGDSRVWVRIGDGDLPEGKIPQHRLRKLIGAIGKQETVDVTVAPVPEEAPALGELHIKAGRLSATMTLEDGDVEYPVWEMTDSPDTKTIHIGWFEGNELARVLALVQPFQSKDEARQNLLGVHWKRLMDSYEVYELAATNGKMLIVEPITFARNSEIDPDQLPEWTLCREAVQTILDAKDWMREGYKFYLYLNGKYLWLRSEDIIIRGRLIDMEFPEYHKVIPDPANPIQYTIRWKNKEVLDTLRRLKPFVGSDVERVIITPGDIGVDLTAPSDRGSVTIAVHAEVEGELDEEWVGLSHLATCLKAIPTPYSILIDRRTRYDNGYVDGPLVLRGDNTEGMVLLMPHRRPRD